MLTSLLDGKKLAGRPPESDRTKMVAEVTECLKTYDILGLWRDAEDILRREIVEKFVKKVVLLRGIENRDSTSNLRPSQFFLTHSMCHDLH
jgi:hypothetical protein